MLIAYFNKIPKGQERSWSPPKSNNNIWQHTVTKYEKMYMKIQNQNPQNLFLFSNLNMFKNANPKMSLNLSGFYLVAACPNEQEPAFIKI